MRGKGVGIFQARDLIRMKSRAEWLRTHLEPGEKILDVNAGDLSVYEQMKPKPHTILDPNYYRIGGKLCWKGKGDFVEIPKLYRKAFKEDASSLGLLATSWSNNFDAVLMLDVLENLENPKRVLKAALMIARKKVLLTIHRSELESETLKNNTSYPKELDQVLGEFDLEESKYFETPYWKGWGIVVRSSRKYTWITPPSTSFG